MTDSLMFRQGRIAEEAKSEEATALLLGFLGHFDTTTPNLGSKLDVVRPRELNELRSGTELVFEGSSASSLSLFRFYFKDGQVSTLGINNLFQLYYPSLKSWHARASQWAERYDRSKIVLTEAEEELYYQDELLNVMDVD